MNQKNKQNFQKTPDTKILKKISGFKSIDNNKVEMRQIYRAIFEESSNFNGYAKNEITPESFIQNLSHAIKVSSTFK